jgi:quinoprotein dehydrogenase-associated probable ABC transporter substrate-binding protein
MSSRCRSLLLVLTVPVLLAGGPAREPPRALRVCADPNNLPFSNEKGDGFENRIAALLAREMGTTVSYMWWPQRRGFIRNTLKAGRCDVVMGVPATDGMVLTTAPYYASTYVFLSRRDSGLHVSSFDDPVLRRVRIGIHLIGDDYTNPPPAHALGRRGIAENVKGYTLYGDYSKPNPPARLVDAVATGDVDVAIIWGPFAGYFAPREGVPMTITPVSPRMDPPGLPFVFSISLGVRPEDRTLKAELDGALARRRSEIHRILRAYGVPLVNDTEPSCAHC